MTRIPVRAKCLARPHPFQLEYFCSRCRTPFLTRFPPDAEGRCGVCRRGLSGFDSAYSYGAYEDELRKLIHLFKYAKVQTLAGPLAKLLRLALPLDERFDLIVPMPMHWMKRWRRGFNQAELLARDLGRRTGRPVANLARRVHQKTAQAGLTSALRRENVADAFRVRDRRKVEGKRVLLVDDVMPTGATWACAKVLNRACAARVILLTVARVDRRIAAAEHRISAESFAESSFSGSFEDAKSGSFA